MPCRAVTWILVTTIMCLKWELLSSVMINGRPHAWISATTWELPNMMLRCKDLFWFSMFPFTWVCCHTHSGHAAAAAAKSLQSCPTLCNPIDSSPPGSPVPGILQAKNTGVGCISFSNAWKWKGKVKLLSHVWLVATPWTAAYQAPPSMGFSRQEYWSGVPVLILVIVFFI